MNDYGERDEGVVSGINVTPMVDIMMVLLIIFMATARFVSDSSLKVNLPRASNSAVSRGRSVNVTVDAGGAVRVDGHTVSGDDLEGVLKSSRSGRVTVSADKKTAYDSVVKVLDAAKGAGITKVSLATER